MTDATKIATARRRETIRGRKYCRNYRDRYCSRLCNQYSNDPKLNACPVPNPWWAQQSAIREVTS